MSHRYTAIVAWARNGETFSDGRYSRGHVWRFDSGIVVAASASPSVVPLPMSREDAVDPEEAFVASISSCHMLTFLAIAGKKRFIVDSYEDAAVGVMTKNANGKLFVSRVTLDPAVAFVGDTLPTPAQIAELHHLSHKECFIANSVHTDIVVKGISQHSHKVQG